MVKEAGKCIEKQLLEIQRLNAIVLEQKEMIIDLSTRLEAEQKNNGTYVSIGELMNHYYASPYEKDRKEE